MENIEVQWSGFDEIRVVLIRIDKREKLMKIVP